MQMYTCIEFHRDFLQQQLLELIACCRLMYEKLVNAKSSIDQMGRWNTCTGRRLQ
jgi:hypothetical protein